MVGDMSLNMEKNLEEHTLLLNTEREKKCLMGNCIDLLTLMEHKLART